MKCGSSQVVLNGGYQTKNRGLVRRFLCRTCGLAWKEFDSTSGIMSGIRIADPDSSVLEAFALVALGLPLDQVKGLMARKSDTIKGRLLRCFEKQEIWHKVVNRLVSRYGIQPEEIKHLSELLGQIKSGTATFHAAQIRSIKVKAKPGLRREGRNVSRHEQTARNKLAARIRAVLDCEIVGLPDGHFYRLEDDRRVQRWISEVERFDVIRSARRLERLTVMENLVFKQVRCPNEKAHAYAKEEGGRGRKIGDPWLEEMTIRCLAQGVGMEVEYFIALLEFVAQVLRNPDPA